MQRNDTNTYQPGFTQELNDLTLAFLQDENETKLEENCKRMRPTRLTTIFESIDRSADCGNQTISDTSTNVSTDVVAQRRNALRRQHESLTSSSRPRTGTLYIKKMISTKLSWHEMVNEAKPFSHGYSSSHLSDGTSFLDFKFNMFDYYPSDVCRENTDGISLHDDMLLIMNEDNEVGYDAIKSAFLACPYVNGAQLPSAWFDNHLKWIFDKFVAMERAFPQTFAGDILTPENVMLQLKYRYDRDVTRSEISVIRKIIDGQCVPDLPFVGFVSAIMADDEFEFSDGWYAVMAKVDRILADAMRCGKIRVGSKLMVRCWEFDDLPKCKQVHCESRTLELIKAIFNLSSIVDGTQCHN